MVLHAVGAESPFKQIDDAAVFKLASLNLKQIVRESEEPKTCIAQLAKCGRYLAMGRHRGVTAPTAVVDVIRDAIRSITGG